ncbi:hypothetical protein CC86DRAFT_4091 [Ophiobolus disseminans]|uniref:Uncharacterized protein n=1 Tax=Ophiobolus disseminans TaxID=1469910 RepID=A0A6A7AIA8_9PLEO|nr:hypothetical protein CC86DRAFT_4091 [Ophiobolus disseminans]
MRPSLMAVQDAPRNATFWNMRRRFWKAPTEINRVRILPLRSGTRQINLGDVPLPIRRFFGLQGSRTFSTSPQPLFPCPKEISAVTSNDCRYLTHEVSLCTLSACHRPHPLASELTNMSQKGDCSSKATHWKDDLHALNRVMDALRFLELFSRPYNKSRNRGRLEARSIFHHIQNPIERFALLVPLPNMNPESPQRFSIPFGIIQEQGNS